ncbi:unnamed protein product, partial [Rotaria magnacalcarata]
SSATANDIRSANIPIKYLSPDKFQRRSSNTTSSSPISVSCLLIVGEKRVDYRNALNQAIGAVRQRSMSAQNSSLKTFTN